MDEIRVLYRLVITVMCFVCLGLSVGMCSESDALIKTYVSSTLHSDDLLIHEVPKSDWDSLVMESKAPVMVLFTAYLCPTCFIMSFNMDTLDLKFAGRFKFYSVDLDDEPEIGARWGVLTCPTTVVFKLGKVMDKRTGFLNEATQMDIVEKYI
ncbi:hypothetical protein BRARA_F00149 [Brassica rapa]|uniref:Thioredoxin domain-containing protein n=2 Tax=Brassica campestris TaxID=3711 RepID=A0A397YY11_BRACM|nr:hypothetical protein BRARA_F00149 [Brassica rapa]CAG7867899.1 unnamed protein product [Brassica rapa]VDC64818.1 unnamed protein product [Brassica rapa]